MSDHTPRDFRVERRLGWVTPDIQRFAAASPAAVKDQVLAGMCPWCGEGPFVVLAIHTFRKHGVDRFELRDIAGLTYNTSICDPAYAKVRAEMGRAAYEQGRTGITSSRPGHRKVRRSKAFNAVQAERAQGLTHEVRAEAGRRLSARLKSEHAERDRRILEAFKAGATMNEIAAAESLRAHTVSYLLREAGVTDPRRNQVAKAKGKPRDPDVIRAQKELARRKSDELWRARAQAYEAGTPLDQIAATHGITVKSLISGFRKRGIHVPDGRATKPRATDDAMEQILRRRAEGASQQAIGDELGFTQAAISRALIAHEREHS